MLSYQLLSRWVATPVIAITLALLGISAWAANGEEGLRIVTDTAAGADFRPNMFVFRERHCTDEGGFRDMVRRGSLVIIGEGRELQDPGMEGEGEEDVLLSRMGPPFENFRRPSLPHFVTKYIALRAVLLPPSRSASRENEQRYKTAKNLVAIRKEEFVHIKSRLQLAFYCLAVIPASGVEDVTMYPAR